jgi:S1-C subfamily serine protease
LPAPVTPSVSASAPPAQTSSDEQNNIEVYKSISPAVVNITSTVIQYDFFFRAVPSQGAGSGFLIDEKGNILTNYHVISGARSAEVTLSDHSRYPAKLVGRDPLSDLAVLKIEADKPLPYLKFGDSDNLQVGQKVLAIGNPFGFVGTLTTGIISSLGRNIRDESGNVLEEVIQTDAAINPGNSGGPVFQDDRVVGVAFQGIPGLENAGFFIPPPVIDHFLKDVGDGSYDGFPAAGIRVVPLQNPAYRAYLEMSNDSAGARVDSLLPIESTREVLRPDDVLLQVGEYPVGSDGSILFKGNRVFGGAAFQFAQHGENIPLKILRGGKALEVALPVKIYTGDSHLSNQYDRPPRYVVYAGLVFTPLSLDYLKTLGRDWRDVANSEIVYELYYRRHEDPDSARPEPVVLSSTLGHPANVNVRIGGRALIDRIIGLRIERLDDVARAFDSATNTHHVLEFLPNRALETLNRADADRAHPEILKSYSVPQDRRL